VKESPAEEGLTIYKARIKALVKEKGFRISREFIIAFDRAVRELLEKAIRRGEIERRKTLLP